MDESSEVKITIRLPRELHTALVQLAAKERRSLNSEIVVLLERAVPADTTPPSAE